MKSMFTGLALCGSKYECARTDNVSFAVSEVCDGTVFLNIFIYNHIDLFLGPLDDLTLMRIMMQT